MADTNIETDVEITPDIETEQNPNPDPEPVIETHKDIILKNVYIKLDSLPLSFGIPKYSADIATSEELDRLFGLDLKDTLREIRINIDELEENSNDELQVENRTVYHALRRFRLSSSVFFKFSTAIDGKSVDKTQIPKMLNAIIEEYNKEFSQWRSGSTGSLWNRQVQT